MTDTYPIGIAPPTDELLEIVKSILNDYDFSNEEILLFASALQYCANQRPEPHPSVNGNALLISTIVIANEYKDNLSLALSIFQDKYLNGITQHD